MSNQKEKNLQVKPEALTFLSPELLEIQGKNDREFLTLRIKLLLDAKEKYPGASFADISKLADLTACGQGCCCCCGTLVLPGSIVSPESVVNREK